VNLKAKIYIYVNSTIQRCANKNIKIFLIEDFFHLPPVSLTPVVNLELRISPRLLEKIRNGPHGILWAWGWGEIDSEKNPEAKNLVTLSLLEAIKKTCCCAGYPSEEPGCGGVPPPLELGAGGSSAVYQVRFSLGVNRPSRYPLSQRAISEYGSSFILSGDKGRMKRICGRVL
jgi:hypothetical protein